MIRMFDFDRSASRGLMAMRKIVLFEHPSPLGVAPSHLLFDRVKVDKMGDKRAAREFADYAATFSIDRENLPEGIRVIELPNEMNKLEQLGE
jgi:CRISPR-associated protein Csd2